MLHKREKSEMHLNLSFLNKPTVIDRRSTFAETPSPMKRNGHVKTASNSTACSSNAPPPIPNSNPTTSSMPNLPSWFSMAAYLAISVALTTNCIARDNQVAPRGASINDNSHADRVICGADSIPVGKIGAMMQQDN
jgi:hypothetical protein